MESIDYSESIVCVESIEAIASIEASVLSEEDDTNDTKRLLQYYAINWEKSADITPGAIITETAKKLGVATCVSCGSSGDENTSTAWSANASCESIFRFFEFCVKEKKQNVTATGKIRINIPYFVIHLNTSNINMYNDQN